VKHTTGQNYESKQLSSDFSGGQMTAGKLQTEQIGVNRRSNLTPRIASGTGTAKLQLRAASASFNTDTDRSFKF
jgi:hypothetical protein